MNGGRVLWVVGAYLAGSFPSTYLVARMARARQVLELADAEASEGDAHVLLSRYAGGAWGATAAIMDVLKGLAFALAAAHYGDLPSDWLGLAGTVVVAGHAFPFYLRPFAGRGLSCAAGVLLALLPVAMVVAGVVTLVGIVLRTTGPASTVGFGLTPAVAAIQGLDPAMVAMGAAIFALILLRRLAGVSAAAERLGWPMALVRRLVFDSDAPSESARPEPSPTE